LFATKSQTRLTGGGGIGKITAIRYVAGGLRDLNLRDSRQRISARARDHDWFLRHSLAPKVGSRIDASPEPTAMKQRCPLMANSGLSIGGHMRSA